MSLNAPVSLKEPEHVLGATTTAISSWCRLGACLTYILHEDNLLYINPSLCIEVLHFGR